MNKSLTSGHEERLKRMPSAEFDGLAERQLVRSRISTSEDEADIEIHTSPEDRSIDVGNNRTIVIINVVPSLCECSHRSDASNVSSLSKQPANVSVNINIDKNNGVVLVGSSILLQFGAHEPGKTNMELGSKIRLESIPLDQLRPILDGRELGDQSRDCEVSRSEFCLASVLVPTTSQH